MLRYTFSEVELNSCSDLFYYCKHCDESLQTVAEQNLGFCCLGCEQVYHLIRSSNLDEKYYKLLKENGKSKKISLKKYKFKQFTELDSKELLAKLPGIEYKEVEFYLESVHCMACLWLVEKLPQFVPGVIYIRLSLGTNIVKIKFNPEKVKLSEIARSLQSLGYPPHLVDLANLNAVKQKESQQRLLEIGVAGFCTGNIMLFSSSIYAGADSEYKILFLWLCGLFFLPVLFYSARSFFRTSIIALRRCHMSLDMSICFALVFGGGLSFLQLFRANDTVYFDSLAALVFLVLVSRHWLKELAHKNWQKGQLQIGLQSEKVLQIEDNQEIEKRLDEIGIGSLVRYKAGETISVDGILKNETAYLDTSLLTGEFKHKKYSRLDKVYAGFKAVHKNIDILVESIGDKTQLGKIYQQLNHEEKPKVLTEVENWAKAFVLLSLLGSVFCLLYFYDELNVGVERALAFSIISCPCALGLAAPYLLRSSLKVLGDLGVIVKKFSSLESVYNSKNIFFDKTGTLTDGVFHLQNYKITQAPLDDLWSVVKALESESEHPVAKSLLRYIYDNNIQTSNISLIKKQEVLGQGVEGILEGRKYFIGSLQITNKDAGNFVYLLCDGKTLVEFQLGDKLKPNSQRVLTYLNQLKKNLNIISGDKSRNVQDVVSALKLENIEFFSEKSPNEKMSIVKKQEASVMVGDGANDALAQNSSLVGISLNSFANVSLKASDINILNGDITYVARLFRFAESNFTWLRRILILSLMYNIFGGVAAILGWISPLIAAVIMPLSAFSFISISSFAIHLMKKQWGKAI